MSKVPPLPFHGRNSFTYLMIPILSTLPRYLSLFFYLIPGAVIGRLLCYYIIHIL